jgi:hypothetical protein
MHHLFSHEKRKNKSIGFNQMDFIKNGNKINNLASNPACCVHTTPSVK